MIGGDLQAMIDIVQAQSSGSWVNIDGSGGEIDAALAGYLMISQTTSVHHEIAELLSQLRAIEQPELDPKEFIVRCYQADAAMAADLTNTLPELVGAGTWYDADDPDSQEAGRIFSVRRDEATTILVIVQTRAVHEDIMEAVAQIAPIESWGCIIPYLNAFRATGPSREPRVD